MGRLAQPERGNGEGLLEVELEGEVVNLRHALGGVVARHGPLHQRDAGGGALSPPEGGVDEVVGCELVAVLEAHVVAQFEAPGKLVVADLPAVEHVVVQRAVGVEPERELVEVQGHVMGGGYGCPHGVERLHRGAQCERGLAAPSFVTVGGSGVGLSGTGVAVGGTGVAVGGLGRGCDRSGRAGRWSCSWSRCVSGRRDRAGRWSCGGSRYGRARGRGRVDCRRRRRIGWRRRAAVAARRDETGCKQARQRDTEHPQT